MAPPSSSAFSQVQTTAQACMDQLTRATQAAMDTRKRLVRETASKDDLERQKTNLEALLEIAERTRGPELTKVLELADELVRVRSNDKAKMELTEKVSALQMELRMNQDELQRVKERLKDATATNMQFKMRVAEFTEDLTNTTQKLAKAERNSIREASKAATSIQECAVVSKKLEQCEKECVAMKSKLDAAYQRASTARKDVHVKPLNGGGHSVSRPVQQRGAVAVVAPTRKPTVVDPQLKKKQSIANKRLRTLDLLDSDEINDDDSDGNHRYDKDEQSAFDY